MTPVLSGTVLCLLTVRSQRTRHGGLTETGEQRGGNLEFVGGGGDWKGNGGFGGFWGAGGTGGFFSWAW